MTDNEEQIAIRAVRALESIADSLIKLANASRVTAGGIDMSAYTPIPATYTHAGAPAKDEPFVPGLPIK